MPFSTTGSVISTDLDNMLRGLYRDNSDSALTGTLVETTLKSFTIPANTIGPTGGIHLIIAGTIAGVAGIKTLRLKFGGVLISQINITAPSFPDWGMDTWIFNTATNAQRRRNYQTNDTANVILGYGTGSLDTTQNQTLLVTGQLGNVGDTITQTMFDVFIVQIN